jgi:hypothetical protein
MASSVAGMHKVSELTDVLDPAWPSLSQLMAESSVDVVVVPPVINVFSGRMLDSSTSLTVVFEFSLTANSFDLIPGE